MKTVKALKAEEKPENQIKKIKNKKKSHYKILQYKVK